MADGGVTDSQAWLMGESQIANPAGRAQPGRAQTPRLFLTSFVGIKRVSLALSEMGFGYSCCSSCAAVVVSLLFFSQSMTGRFSCAAHTCRAAAASSSKVTEVRDIG